VLALVGYLIGSLLAEVTRRPPVDRGAGARLEAQRPDQYLTPTARRLPAVLAAWVIAAHALSGGASARLARALDATQHALTDDPFTLGITGTLIAIVG
jgi:hypothetical protein